MVEIIKKLKRFLLSKSKKLVTTEEWKPKSAIATEELFTNKKPRLDELDFSTIAKKPLSLDEMATKPRHGSTNESENQTYNNPEVEKLWACLGHLYAQKETLVIEMAKVDRKIGGVAQKLLNLN